MTPKQFLNLKRIFDSKEPGSIFTIWTLAKYETPAQYIVHSMLYSDTPIACNFTTLGPKKLLRAEHIDPTKVFETSAIQRILI